MAVRRDGRGECGVVIALRIVQGGLLTTVQDLGRPGCRQWGIAASGAADPFSVRLANLRVGNRPDAAVLEMTASGISCEAVSPILVAMAGAPMPALRNGIPIEPDTPFELAAGDTLSIGAAARGFRTYLAIGGGIDVPRVLGSLSTHVSAGFGGLRGRKVERGDELSAFEYQGKGPRAAAFETAGVGAPADLRTIAGPQRTDFSEPALARFFEAEFRVSSRSNRMGIRLEGGPAPAPDESGDMVPEGSVHGAIQIPPGGEPIIHMPEGPVTGGYPRIASVISADLGALGQLRPGDRVRFRDVSLEEALQARREREMIFEER